MRLDRACFPKDKPVDLGGAIWWTAECDGKVVGYAGLRVCQAAENAGLAFLCRVGVDRGHRGHGLQKRLIRARERAARRAGVRQVVTYVVPWNEASANSLIACGYRLYRPASRWGGAGCVYFQKRLRRGK